MNLSIQSVEERNKVTRSCKKLRVKMDHTKKEKEVEDDVYN